MQEVRSRLACCVALHLTLSLYSTASLQSKATQGHLVGELHAARIDQSGGKGACMCGNCVTAGLPQPVQKSAAVTCTQCACLSFPALALLHPVAGRPMGGCPLQPAPFSQLPCCRCAARERHSCLWPPSRQWRA